MLNLTDSVTGEYDPRRAASAVRHGLHAVVKFLLDEMRLQELESSTPWSSTCVAAAAPRARTGPAGPAAIMIEGQTVKDERFVLEALDRILKIKERRAKYLGLDAQVRLSVEADQIGGEIAQLIAAINATDDATRDALGVGDVLTSCSSLHVRPPAGPAPDWSPPRSPTWPSGWTTSCRTARRRQGGSCASCWRARTPPYVQHWTRSSDRGCTGLVTDGQLWPKLTPSRQADIKAWLRMHGIDPHRVPLASEIRINGADDNWRIEYERYPT